MTTPADRARAEDAAAADEAMAWARTPTPTELAYGRAAAATPADAEELATFYLHLADAEFDGYCDLYASLARSIAADDEFLARIAAIAPAAKIIPVLLFAAVHDRLLADPDHPLAVIYRGGAGDAYPYFRDLVLAEYDHFERVVRTRSIQTNEVGRSAVLLPVLTMLRRAYQRPLAMIEIGPSAGLNLFVDRFGYTYTAEAGGAAAGERVLRRVGDPAATVQLTCAVRGPLRPPLDDAAPSIVSRRGIDLNPIDVRDAAACRWLEACIWPRLPERSARFRAAVALARTDPPDLRRGSAADHLPALLAELPADVLPVVTSTWVLAYFTREGRAAFGALLDDLARTRDLACITAEYPSIAPFIDRPARAAHDATGQAATLVGASTWRGGTRDSRPIAWTHAHGRWIDWLDAASADG